MPLNGLHVQSILCMIMLQYDADLIIDLMRMDKRRRRGTSVPRAHYFSFVHVSPTVFSRLQEGLAYATTRPLESCYIVLFT
jgi:hypothetical protein